jgi:hypothetical protein
MDLAFMSGAVPPHLYGATQHKTLGARLSEDILHFRKRSKFFRTRPGRFFLREFIHDRSLPLEFRTPIVATRRRRQLRRKNVAAVDRDFLSKWYDDPWKVLPAEKFSDLVRSGAIQYINLDELADDAVPVYSYAVITRSNELLLHTKGTYAEARPGYVSKAMLGFPIPICHDDLTLFDLDDHGIVQAGLTAVANDLDLEFSPEFPSFELSAELVGLAPLLLEGSARVLVGVVSVEAPPNFEPLGKRLAIGNLEWLRLGAHLSRSNFDPWSRDMLMRLPSLLDRKLL